MFPYAFPLSVNKSNSEKGPSRKGKANDNSYTSMANTTSVTSAVRDVNAMSTAVDTTARSTVRSSKRQTPFNSIRETNVSGLKSYGR